MRPWIAAAFAATSLAACATAEPDRGAMDRVTPRQAWIVGAEGAAIGQAMFTEGPRGVMIRLELSANALPPGWHGVHLHGIGNCSDRAAGFQASGSHLGHDEDGPQHGLMNPAGSEQGDLPNLFAPPNAPFGAEYYVAGATLANDLEDRARFELLDDDGTALLIHAGPDDQQSQPIGGAGARIACAALTQLP
ncbi:MAG: superoxide dismutase family protein [Hyphomonadaceae bacterium]|nr:superoxide dismutase family protein [Hyphomonadaceae bacterium]